MREENRKVTMVDGIIITEITPRLTEEEERAAINDLAWKLIEFGKSRNRKRNDMAVEN